MKFNLFVGTVCSALFVSLAAANSMAQVSDPYGTVASQALPDRIVQVDGGTKFINVHQGEVIKFVFQDQSFTWKFDTFNRMSFEFGVIAPKNFANSKAVIYLDPNPLYTG